MPYSFGKLFRNVVGKSGRKIRNALTDSIIQNIQNPSVGGSGMYTGMGMYTGAGAYRRKRYYRRRNAPRRASRKYGRKFGNNLIRGAGGKTNATITTVGNETGDVIITHKEYLGDQFGPEEAFNVQSYQLNPGLESTFPWLAQIASNYEEYAFKQLVFSYRSTVTDIGSSTSGQCGTCIMATNYNPDSKPFYDKGQMLEYAHAMSCKTTESMDHGVECDPTKKNQHRLFVRSGPPANTSSDLKDYDTGKFQFAIANIPPGFVNQSLGELWVYYTVQLSKPKIFTGRGNAISRFYCASQYFSTTDANWPTGSEGFKAGYIAMDKQSNFQVDVSPVTGGVNVTFPANFGGAVKITMQMRPVEAVAGAGLLFTNTQVNSGNIDEIRDMVVATGNSYQPGYWIAGPIVGVGQSTGDTMIEAHYFIRQASSGTNNVIGIDLNPGCSSKVQCWLCVEEYNSFGIEHPAKDSAGNKIYQQPIFIMPDGTTKALSSV